MCASPWSQPFTVPGPLSGQPCSCAPSLASCSGQASFSPLWSGEGCPSLPLTLARKEPVAEEGAALLLLQHEDCSTADQALLAASEAPAMHWTRDGKKSWLQLVLDLQDRGTHINPVSRGHHPTGSTYTLLPTMPWARCSHPGCCKQGKSKLPAVGEWKMGVMKHRCISLPCSHTCSGCCPLKAASLVLSPRRVAGAEVELGSRQQQYTQ